MNNQSIVAILRESALMLKHEYDESALRFVEINSKWYDRADYLQFKTDLVEAGSKVKLLFLEQAQQGPSIPDFVRTHKVPLLALRVEGDRLQPLIFYKEKDYFFALSPDSGEKQPIAQAVNADFLLKDDTGQVVSFVIYPYKSLVSDVKEDRPGPRPISPVRRFFGLLSTERRDVFYILFYSIVIGLTGLVLPVGIQNTVQLVSGGVFFSSIYVLISAVILGILFTGIFQIIQITLVEYLQRRVFTKASLEFAFRIPRIRMESIVNNHAPELVNRFFDVVTLQKGLPKLLIDLVSSALQILFGLVLLSLYHPTFVFFSLFLLTTLFLIFWLTGPSAMESSIGESKYKYKVVHWLEELARALNSFKLAGNTDLPIRKTDAAVSNYLKYRKSHFRILISQYSFIVLFKTAVTATLLIVGTVLVTNREITLGQFVASEVIIILILSSVEKVISYMDVVYDVFTAVDKIAQITDLPLERAGGLDIQRDSGSGYGIVMKDLKYKYPGASGYALKGIDLKIRPGEKVCLAGPGNGGKTTLTNVVAGLHSDYEGVLTINNYSLRDLDLRHLRDSISKNISPEDIFDGTILENITLGHPRRTVEEAMNAIRNVKLEDDINRLPEGLSTHLLSGSKGSSHSFVQKLILARCLAKKPSLLILNDFFSGLKRPEKLQLLQSVIGEDNRWTLLAVSNDPMVMAACERVVILADGKVSDDGHFDDLLKQGILNSLIQ